MVAARNLKNTTSIRVGSLLHVLHPRTIHPQWNAVLGLARYCTCMATNALAVVNNKAVSHATSPCGAILDPRDLLLRATILRTPTRNLPSEAMLRKNRPSAVTHHRKADSHTCICGTVAYRRVCSEFTRWVRPADDGLKKYLCCGSGPTPRAPDTTFSNDLEIDSQSSQDQASSSAPGRLD